MCEATASLRQKYILVCVSSFVGSMILGAVCVVFPHVYTLIKPYAFWSFILLLVLFIVTGSYLHHQQCPKCGNKISVHKSGTRSEFFTLHCLNCNETKGSGVDI